MATVRFGPVDGIQGDLTVPTDKSITHRAILFGALSDRTVRVDTPLDSQDTGATLAVVEACGVRVRGDLVNGCELDGVGLRGLRPPERLDCMNAGTLMRLLAGIMVGQDTDVTLDGDASLRRRPMSRVSRPLTAMGARVTTAPGGVPPVQIHSGAHLRGRRHDLAVASAQVKSCLLLAGLFADGETWITEPVRSRDHTERMLAAAGAPIAHDDGAIGVVGPVGSIALPDVRVPGDFSSAAFHLVAGVLRADPEVRLLGVNLNPTRSGLLDVLRRMGADIEVEPVADAAGEPCGNLTVRRATDLRGTTVDADEIPGLVDEVMLVALLGAVARGETRIRGAGELRVKESDRIATTAAALRGVGVHVTEQEDGLTVTGGSLRGGSVEAAGDHRIAMLGAIAGLVSEEGVSVSGMEAAAVSYPNFMKDLATLGAT